MQIVIDIPNSLYANLQKIERGSIASKRVLDCVRNGTPLPKGHGRLIDANELEECKEMMNTISGESKYAVLMANIRNIPTIIEADRAESEEA